MKKYLLLLFIFLFGVLSGYSQSDSERFAKKAFDSGNYNDAVQLYQAAIALTANATAKSELNQSLSKARTCASLVQKAQTYLNAGNYSNAKKYYQALLVQNPADLNAQRQIDRCSQLIKTATIKAANKKKRDAAYNLAVKTGDIAPFNEFIKAYPDDNVTSVFQKYIAFKSNSNYIPQINEVAIYKRLGDIFTECGNLLSAREMYDLAASVCDLEAMFKKASTYGKNDIEKTITLLAIAAAGNYQPAKNKLAELKQTSPFRYNEIIAKNYYKHLSRCTQNLESALYVAVNIASYPLEHVHPDYSEIFKLTADELVARKISDHLLYFIGLKTGATNLMTAAAMQGNVTASKWLGEQLDKTKYATQAAVLTLCYDSFSKYDEPFANYLKYLKQDKTVDWFMVYLCACFGSQHGPKELYNTHDELIALTKVKNSYRYKKFKDFLKAQRTNKWDKNVVAECRSYAWAHPNKWSKKVVKALDKLNTEANLFSIKNNPIWQFVQKGYFDNRHYYHTPTELLTVSLLSPSKAQSTASTRTSATSRKSGDTTGSSTLQKASSSARPVASPEILLDEAYNAYNGIGCTKDKAKALRLAQQAHKAYFKIDQYSRKEEYTYKYGSYYYPYKGIYKVCINNRWGIVVINKGESIMVIPCLFAKNEIYFTQRENGNCVFGTKGLKAIVGGTDYMRFIIKSCDSK